jgi:hypothetical protein
MADDVTYTNDPTKLATPPTATPIRATESIETGHEGKLIQHVKLDNGDGTTSLYASPANFISGTTAAITDTTRTELIASAGGSLRNYLTQITVTNSHATVGTFVKIEDNTTTIYQAYAAPLGGGFALTFPVPLRGTAATAWNVSCVTTGANVIANASGYTGV